jgi:Uma2 family endonuclease
MAVGIRSTAGVLAMSAPTLTPPESPLVIPPRDDLLYEVVDGEIQEVVPMGVRETRIASCLMRPMAAFVHDNHLGRVDTEMLYQLRPNLQRRPDLAFVSYARWPIDRPVPESSAWDVVPDLAVEIISPSEFGVDILAKVREYLTAGVRVVWLVYRGERLTHVYESMTQIRVVTDADELTGDPVLPGFRLPLATLLEDATDPA